MSGAGSAMEKAEALSVVFASVSPGKSCPQASQVSLSLHQSQGSMAVQRDLDRLQKQDSSSTL